MNVLLVQPIKETRHTLNLMPPLGLGYLASSIRDAHSVKILDCVKEGFTLDVFGDYIKKDKPDIIGFTTFSCDLENVKRSIDVTKRLCPGIITIGGGPHPSCDPLGTMTYLNSLDFAFTGESEIGFALLLDALSKGYTKDKFYNIPGLVWRDNGQIHINQKIFVEDLDTIRFPSWDLIRPDTYKGVPNGVFTKQYPFAPIIATRGCPYLCTFCSAHNIVGRKIRSRSINNVMQEIELLCKDYGIREIHIEDDNFTFNIRYAKEFCHRIMELDFPLSYCCPNGIRLDRIDEELLELMKKAGFYNIYVGIESGSPRILKHMKKNLSLKEISDKVNLIKKIGLEVSAYFILGYPQESVEDIKKTIEYAKSINLDWAQFATFIPLPGSEIAEDVEVKNSIKNLRWSDFFNTEVPFSPPDITKEELKKLQREAFLSFYLRPKQFFNLLKHLRFTNILFIFRRIIRYLIK